MTKPKILAVIPARGGSKRIPQKNIKSFFGKPIIEYSIEAALKSKLFDEVMVSTESQEIAKIARQAGAKVPYFRSAKNSNDQAGLAAVLLEVLLYYEKKGQNFDHLCCLFATAPLVSASILRKSYLAFKSKKASALISVVGFGYPVQRALRIYRGNLEMVNPTFYSNRSQDLEKLYHDAGAFYWLRNVDFLKEKKIFLAKSGAYPLSALETQDIDHEEDWFLAEMKYQLQQRLNRTRS